MISAAIARQTSVNSNKGVRDALFNIDQAIKNSCEQPVNNFYVEVSKSLVDLSMLDIEVITDVLRKNGYTVECRNSSEVLVKW